MENKAHYALIGTFVLLALFAVIAFVSWLSNEQFDTQFDEYEVTFNGAVRGVSQGSEVRFNGLKVGEVTKLRLDPQNSGAVIVDIQVEEETPVDTKSFARLEPLGLTGLNYIQVFAGGDGFPLIKELPGRGPRRIEGQMSQFETLIDGGGSVIESVQSALNRVNGVMSPEAIDDLHAILSNVRQVTENLRDVDIDSELVNKTLVAIRQAANDVSAAALAVDVAADDFDLLIKQDIKSVLARAEVSMGELDKTVGSIGTAANGTDDLIADSRDAINRVSNSGLTDLEETLDAMRRIVVTLGQITDDINQNPRQFIAGTEKETVEIPQ